MKTRDNQQEQIEKYSAYAFVSLIAIFAIVLIVTSSLGDFRLGIRISSILFTLAFIVFNGATFYTGTFTWLNGPTFSREKSPAMFYLSSFGFSAVSALFCAVIIYAAFYG